VHGSRPTKEATGSVFFTAQRTQGDFEFLDGNGTELNPYDDFVRRRENNDHESYDLLLRYVRELPGGSEVTLSNEAFYKDEGAPGVSSGEESTTARFRVARDIVTGHWKSRTGDTSLTGALTYLGETLVDPKSPTTNDLGFGFIESDNTTVSADMQGSWSRSLGERHFLEASMEGTFEYFRGRFPQNAGAAGGNEDRSRLSVAVGDEIYFGSVDLTLAPQLRAEALWNNFDGDVAFVAVDDIPPSTEGSVDPRLGIRWDIDDDVTVRANAATYFRPPTFSELFGDEGSAASNPELTAESGTNYDVGFLLHYKRLSVLESAAVEYAFFRNEAEDLILLATTGASVPKSFNFDSARTSGHELRVEATGPGGLVVEANYTWQNAKNLSNIADIQGKRLPNMPAEEGFLSLGLSRPRWSVEYTLAYRGNTFLDAANNPLRRVSAYGLHGLAFSLRPFFCDVEIKFEADNLTDERVLDQWAFPRPGRSFYVTLSYAGNGR
jgi:iron complex outermembrane receptor protein